MAYLSLFGDDLGTILGPFWDDFGTILARFRDHFGITKLIHFALVPFPLPLLFFLLFSLLFSLLLVSPPEGITQMTNKPPSKVGGGGVSPGLGLLLGPYKNEGFSFKVLALARRHLISNRSGSRSKYMISSRCSKSSRQVLGFSSEVWGFSSQVLGFSSEVLGFSSEVLGFSSEVWGFSSEVLGFSSGAEVLSFSAEVLALALAFAKTSLRAGRGGL